MCCTYIPIYDLFMFFFHIYFVYRFHSLYKVRACKALYLIYCLYSMVEGFPAPLPNLVLQYRVKNVHLPCTRSRSISFSLCNGEAAARVMCTHFPFSFSIDLKTSRRVDVVTFPYLRSNFQQNSVKILLLWHLECTIVSKLIGCCVVCDCTKPRISAKYSCRYHILWCLFIVQVPRADTFQYVCEIGIYDGFVRA